LGYFPQDTVLCDFVLGLFEFVAMRPRSSTCEFYGTTANKEVASSIRTVLALVIRGVGQFVLSPTAHKTNTDHLNSSSSSMPCTSPSSSSHRQSTSLSQWWMSTLDAESLLVQGRRPTARAREGSHMSMPAIVDILDAALVIADEIEILMSQQSSE
jgi:hypothetical protein